MLTFQIDSFEQCVPELKKLFPMHHRELGLLRDQMPLDPDYEEYARRERDGSLFMITGRQAGEIVAYYVACVRSGFHYKSTLTGTADIYYVTEANRGRGLALPLFRMVERELRRRGCSVWYSGHKIHNPLGADRMHELMGFIPADHYWIKSLS